MSDHWIIPQSSLPSNPMRILVHPADAEDAAGLLTPPSHPKLRMPPIVDASEL